MWQKLLGESSFFLLLLSFDQDLAQQARAGTCPYCGARLHWARYWRHPRGAPAGMPAEYDRRDSLCCSAEGCRKRVLPPSLRFFGRRVYLGPVFVLVCAMVHGVNDRRAAALRELVGVSRRTLARWRTWWQEDFCQSGFWRAARARFSPPVDGSGLPASLVERFGSAGLSEGALGLLEFLMPLTTGSGCAVGP